MRNPIEVLKTLQEKAGNENYQFERLYRNLYNEEFFLLAYGNLSAKEGNLTKGTDGATIDGMGMERIRKLIESLRNHSYQPSPARRAYIPKSNGKRRPLGIPSVDDKLVQEVVQRAPHKVIPHTIFLKSLLVFISQCLKRYVNIQSESTCRRQ